jgi:hypothetical protein
MDYLRVFVLFLFWRIEELGNFLKKNNLVNFEQISSFLICN